MASERLIRVDEYGLYVITGGYTFRPLDVAKKHFFPKDKTYAAAANWNATVSSDFKSGMRIKATHISGSTSAKVGNEVWVSSSIDPKRRITKL